MHGLISNMGAGHKDDDAVLYQYSSLKAIKVSFQSAKRRYTN